METTFKLDTPIKMDGHNYDLVCVSAKKNDYKNTLDCTIHYAEETEFGLSMSLFGCQMQYYNICPMARKNQKKIDAAMQYVEDYKDTIVPLFIANDTTALKTIFSVLGQSL